MVADMETEMERRRGCCQDVGEVEWISANEMSASVPEKRRGVCFILPGIHGAQRYIILFFIKYIYFYFLGNYSKGIL